MSRSTMKPRRLGYSTATIVIALCAALLLVVGVSGSAWAVISTVSDAYTARIATSQIGVALMENGSVVATSGDNGSQTGTLLRSLAADDGPVKPGVEYPEEIRAVNTGDITQYVRVTLRRYWVDEDGTKVCDVSPDLIGLTFTEGQGWIRDDAAATEERLVFYYTQPLEPGAQTPPLTTSLRIDPIVAQKVTETFEEENGYRVITTTYDYDGLNLCLEAVVDAVQEHNIEDAALSAWGASVSDRGSSGIGL